MENTSTDITVKKAALPSAVAFGMEGISHADIILPKLLIMQKMSKLLDHIDVKAKEGDILDSLTKSVVASDKPVEIIPLQMKKYWREVIGVKPNESFKRFLVTSENVNLPYEEPNIKRHQETDWFVLLPSQIKEGTALPCVITFKKTSMPASRKLATFTVMAAQLKQPACAFAYELKTVKNSNEHGSFCAFEIGGKRKSTKEEMEAAGTWSQMLQGGTHKADSEELEEAPF